MGTQPDPATSARRAPDKGIDGNLTFGRTHWAIVSVKAGDNVGVEMVRSLDSVVKRERAEIGVLLTLTPPTAPMKREAAAAGLHPASRSSRSRRRSRCATALSSSRPPRRRLQARRPRGGAGAPGPARPLTPAACR